LTVFNILIN